LGTYRDRHESLSTQEISNIMFQICLGLEYIHKKGLIHRDISPDNILVYEDGSIRICDFGLAAYGKESKLFAGKDDYMAIEIRDEKAYDYKCDVYSLGVVLWYLCSNSSQYNGKKIVNNLKQTEDHHISLESKHKGLEEILNKMLRYYPKNRPTVKELL